MSSNSAVKYQPKSEAVTPVADRGSSTANENPKDPRSKAKYNLISRIFFFWVDALLCLGCRRDLEQRDLYAHPSEADSAKLLRQFGIYWSQELQRKVMGRKPRLWMVIAKSFKWQLLLQGILAFIEVAMLIGQSLILGELVDYFTEVSTTQISETCFPSGARNLTNVTRSNFATSSSRDAYLYAFGLVLLALIVAMIHAHYALIGTKVGMMARIMTTSAIYQKVLRMSQTAIHQITVGHVINVVSNDVQRFDLAFIFLPFLLIAPLHIGTFTYLVYREVGWVVFVTLFFFVLQIPVQLGLAKIFTLFRFRSAEQTDKRVHIMNEVITGIRVIKMYAWEYAFKKVITTIRKNETYFIRIGGMIRTLTASFNFGVALTLYMALTFLTFVGTGGDLTPRRVIITLSLLGFLRNISASFLIRAVFLLFEAKVAFVRIQNILEQEEKIPEPNVALSGKINLDQTAEKQGIFRESPWLPSTRKVNTEVEPVELKAVVSHVSSAASPVISSLEEVKSPQSNDPPLAALQDSIKVNGLSASWSDSVDKLTLKNISFEVDKQKSFLAVVGKVGSGKSTLLQCLLKELKALEGSVEVNGHVSYVSQNPWVFSGTIQENILFGLPYDQKKYDKVIAACALKPDFEELPERDLTLVGERGVTLSGGQKARVSLARAVYHDAGIYLLDDPLSAVDTAVGKLIYDRCIRGLLLHSLVILVTHQVQFAVQADQLLALNEGEVQLYHSKEELEEKGLDHHQLLKLLKDEAEKFVYDDVNDDEDEDDYGEGEEEEEDDKFGDEINNYFGSPLSSLRTSSISEPTYRRILSREDSIDNRRAVGLEESITSLNQQRYNSLRREDNLLGSLMEPSGYINDSLGGKEETDGGDAVTEEKAHGTISLKTYFNFFRAGGNYIVLFIAVVMFILAEFSIVLSDSWLSEWSNCAVINIEIFESCGKKIESICYLTETERRGIYGGVTITSIILNFVRSALFYLICVNASRVLHNRMFKAIIQVPVRFFDTNPSGRVLNRFSKDIGFLDDLLPHTFLEYLFLLLKFFAVLGTASYGNPYVLIPAFLVVVAFISIRWYFLKTSRDVKRLEAIARSPVYSHFSITLQGLSTIRTLKKERVTTQLFHNYQNQHTQGWYLYLVTSRWFGMRIDLISAAYLGIVTFISIPLAEDLDAGIVGLGLAYTIALAGVLQFCVRQSAEVENIMISTERIMGYSQLSPEAFLETPPDKTPPDNWPQKGGIKMEGVLFRYDPSLPYVIKNLNFDVKPSEKVGIVGRTGAGKSSLISILFRLAEPQGIVMIDGIETKTVGLYDLRKKMSIIPQDPVLFSGSMRYNLDPCNEYDDNLLWKALEQVQLKSTVEEMSAGLSEEVSEGGSNFSVGQKQLVCLARALLKNNKILILDEATANVDPGTDEIIQQTIRTNFKDCTVLTIAHRLNTIMDSDKIMVMNRGQVVEFDKPYNLLQKSSSVLYRMVEKTGPEASRELHGMVKKPTFTSEETQ